MIHTEKKEGKAKGKVLLFLIGAATLIVCLFFGCWYIRGQKRKDIFQVTVRTEYYTGRGVWYAIEMEKGYIVTAGHILSGLTEGDACEVVLADGREGEAKVLYLSDTADVAFLLVEDTMLLEGNAVVRRDRQRFDALQEGDILYLVVSKGGQVSKVKGELLENWIYLEDFELNMMLARMEVGTGMSGSAILDKKGYFTGILCGSSEEGEIAILPLSVIESEWILVP